MKDFLTKASLVDQEYRTVAFDNGIKALENKDIKLAFNLFKQVREDKKENQRKKTAPYYMKYITHPTLINEQAIIDRIDFLKNEITKNPTYVDLYAELARCYLVNSKLNWQHALKQYQKTLELNPSLSGVEENLKLTSELMVAINQTVLKVDEKG